MPKNRTDWIKEELTKDFDAPAQQVADTLKKKGVTVDAQHVYQVRSQIRRAKEERIQAAILTREQNTTSLHQHVLNALDTQTDGLSDRQLEKAIKKAGYVSRAADFLDVLRKKLYEMAEKGVIAKNGLQYTLAKVATAAPPSSGKLVSAAKHVPAPAAVAAVDAPTIHRDYALLRRAVVDFAKNQGFKNPETFPDTLIRLRMVSDEAEKKYQDTIAGVGSKG